MLPVTLAMAARVTAKLWSLEMAARLEAGSGEKRAVQKPGRPAVKVIEDQESEEAKLAA